MIAFRFIFYLKFYLAVYIFLSIHNPEMTISILNKATIQIFEEIINHYNINIVLLSKKHCSIVFIMILMHNLFSNKYGWIKLHDSNVYVLHNAILNYFKVNDFEHLINNKLRFNFVSFTFKTSLSSFFTWNCNQFS